MTTYIVIAILLLIVGVAIYGAGEIIRIPYLGIPYTPKDFKWPFETFTFSSLDGLKLSGWFVPSDKPSDATIVVVHGKGSNAGDMLLNTRALRDGGSWNLFYFDLRGHGNSEGKITSLGPLERLDLEAALAHLKKTWPDKCKRLAIYGHSLGAAVSIIVTATHPEVMGLLIESPFARITRTIKRFAWRFYRIPDIPFMDLSILLASLRLRNNLWNFAPVRYIDKISPRPILIIQAQLDRRTPLEDGDILFKAAKEPKELWVVKDADHGKPWEVAKDEYERRMSDFFRRVFA